MDFQSAVLTALALALGYIWLDYRRSQQALLKPLLVPTRISSVSDVVGGLFCKNFSHPVDDEFKHRGMLCVGIKNIGPGIAKEARATSFWSSDRKFQGGGFAHIPSAETVPLLIRFGYSEPDEIENRIYGVLINYSDVFGQDYVLQLQLWFRQLAEDHLAEAIVINFSDSQEPLPMPDVPIFRHVEYQGYFELEDLRERLKSGS